MLLQEFPRQMCLQDEYSCQSTAEGITERMLMARVLFWATAIFSVQAHIIPKMLHLPSSPVELTTITGNPQDNSSTTAATTQDMSSTTAAATQDMSSTTAATTQDISSTTAATTQEYSSTTAPTTQDISSTTAPTTQVNASTTAAVTQDYPSTTAPTTLDNSSTIQILEKIRDTLTEALLYLRIPWKNIISSETTESPTEEDSTPPEYFFKYSPTGTIQRIKHTPETLKLWEEFKKKPKGKICAFIRLGTLINDDNC